MRARGRDGPSSSISAYIRCRLGCDRWSERYRAQDRHECARDTTGEQANFIQHGFLPYDDYRHDGTQLTPYTRDLAP